MAAWVKEDLRYFFSGTRVQKCFHRCTPESVRSVSGYPGTGMHTGKLVIKIVCRPTGTSECTICTSPMILFTGTICMEGGNSSGGKHCTILYTVRGKFGTGVMEGVKVQFVRDPICTTRHKSLRATTGLPVQIPPLWYPRTTKS